MGNHGHTVAVGHEHEIHHAHAQDDHHEESFVSKYIFSMDHKTISRQFLITAVVMAVIAMVCCGLSLVAVCQFYFVCS